MAHTNPIRIQGDWSDGYALDLHTTRSVYLGDNEYGHPEFDTEYSEVGALVKAVKYRGDLSRVPELIDTAAHFIRHWGVGIDVVVPAPPSRQRRVQPVEVIASGIAQALGVADGRGAVWRTKAVPELKGLANQDERAVALDGAHDVNPTMTRGRRVLLFDDLFRSGAPMGSAARLLLARGGATEVFALTLTKTRTNR